MADPIEDPGELSGAEVYDQIGQQIGSIRRLLGSGGDGPPSWVGIDVSTGMLGRELVLVPLARLKQEDGQVRVPYDKQHLLEAPQLDSEDSLSEEMEERLNDYYAVSRGDQPAQDNPDSYASQTPDGNEPPEPIDEPD